MSRAPALSSIIVVPFRARLESEDWKRLVGLAETVVVPEGATLFHRGDPGGDLYVVEQGMLAILDGRTNPETILDLLGTGALVGEMAFVDGAPRSADVRARVETTCWRWTRATLHAALAEDAAFARSFYRAISEMVVARARAFTSSAMLAGVHAAPPRTDPDAPHAGPLADRLRTALWAGGDGEAARDALGQLARWLGQQADDTTGPAAEALRTELADALDQSTTARLLLERPPGALCGPRLFAHVNEARPKGTSAMGLALDAALLRLPSLRGMRWCTRRAARLAIDLLPTDRPARVLAVPCGSGAVLTALLPHLARRGAEVICIDGSDAALAAASARLAAAPSITLRLVRDDLGRLGTGRSTAFHPGQDLVLIEGLADLLPDRQVAGLATWGLAQGGALLTTHATPAPDGPLFGHLLRWPRVYRRADHLGALLGTGGPVLVEDSGDASVAGAVALTRRST